MRNTIQHLLAATLPLALLLPLCPEAGAQDQTPPASLTPPKTPVGSLPFLRQTDEKAKHNICPVCGKTRSECYDLHERSKKDPSLASQVCAIWKPEFITGITRPWNCPICGLKVNMPQDGMKWEDADTDLCPYPVGKIRFTSELVICPKSGFSAFQEDFRKPQPQAIMDWVTANLTPIMDKALRARLGPQAKVTPQQLIGLYEDQQNIPDTLRCTNAYQYYLKRFQERDPQVKASGLARVAWLAAWANRREISLPVQSGPLMEGVQKISALIQKNKLEMSDMESTIRMLTGLFNDKDRFDMYERQLLRIFQAGYYNRLGLNFWAQTVLEQASAEAEKKYPDPASDPWMQSKSLKNLAAEAKLNMVNTLKASIIDECTVRRNCLMQENTYLGYAAELIILALRNNEYDPADIPSYTYLAGEFFRRQEQFSRSLLWLDATRQMLGDTPRIQHMAPVQLDLLKRYVADRRLTPTPFPKAQEDWDLLQQLAIKAKQANEEARKRKAPVTAVTPGK